jgi:hypothetical protein
MPELKQFPTLVDKNDEDLIKIIELLSLAPFKRTRSTKERKRNIY